MRGWYSIDENTQARELTVRGKRVYRVIVGTGNTATYHDYTSKTAARAAGYNVK